MSENKFYKKNLEEIFLELKTSFDGLSSDEAKKRLEVYGENKISLEKLNFKKILKEIKSPFFIILFFSFLLSLILGYKNEAVLIFLILILKIAFVLFSEILIYKATNYDLFEDFFVVKRDGNWTLVNSKYLVPGDIIKIFYGDVAPCDIKIFKSYDLKIQDNFEKEHKKLNENNFVFAGSFVKNGEGEGVVINTGKNIYFWEEKQIYDFKESKFLKELFKFLKVFLYIAIFISFLILIFAFLNKQDLKESLLEIFSILIGIMPQWAVFLFSFSILNLVYDFYKNKIFVRNIFKIEDLNNVNLIICDKNLFLKDSKLEKIIFNGKNLDKLISFVLNILDIRSDLYKSFLDFINEKKIKIENLKVIEKKIDDDLNYKVCFFEDDKKIHFVLGSPVFILKNFKVKNSKNLEKEIINYMNKGYDVLCFGIKKSKKLNIKFKKLDDFGFFVISNKTNLESKDIFEKIKNLKIKVLCLMEEASGLIKQFVQNGFENLNFENLDLENLKTKVLVSSSKIEKLKIINQIKDNKNVAFILDNLFKKVSGVLFSFNFSKNKNFSDFILLENSISKVFYAILKSKISFSKIKNIILIFFSFFFSIYFVYLLSSILNTAKPLFAVQLLFLYLIEIAFLSFLFFLIDKNMEELENSNRGFIKNFIFFSIVFLLFSLIFYFSIIKNSKLQTIYFVFSYWAPYVLALNIFSYGFKKIEILENKSKKLLFLLLTLFYFLLFILSFIYLKSFLYLNHINIDDFIFTFFVIILLNFLIWLVIKIFDLKC
jgi:Ca2+-transporting ATPase